MVMYFDATGEGSSARIRSFTQLVVGDGGKTSAQQKVQLPAPRP
jgi:hypothetical protein